MSLNPYQLPSDERSLLEITEATLRRAFESRVSSDEQHQRSKFLPEPVRARTVALAHEPVVHDANLLVFKREGARLLLSAHWKRERAEKLLSEISSKEQHVETAQNVLDADWIRFENFLKTQASDLRAAINAVDSLAQKRAALRDTLSSLRGQSEIAMGEISLVQKNRLALRKYGDFLAACGHPESPVDVVTRLKNLEENSISLLSSNEDLRTRLDGLKSEISGSEEGGGNFRSQRLCMSRTVAVLESQTQSVRSQCDRKSRRISDLHTHLKFLEQQVGILGETLDFQGERTAEQHLLAVERFVEEFAAVVARLEPATVQEKEKRLEKTRRERMRGEYLAAANSKMEERSAAALRRAQAPVIRRRAKPLMARSAPPRHVEDLLEQQETSDVDKREEEKHLLTY